MPDTDLLDAARAMAGRAAAGPPELVRRMKATVQATDAVTDVAGRGGAGGGAAAVVHGSARLRRAAGVAARADEGGSLTGDPRWEIVGSLGGSALAALGEAEGRAPVEPELARVEAVGLVRERSELTGRLPRGRPPLGARAG